MIVVSSLSSGDRDATLTDFPLDENSKLSPKVLEELPLLDSSCHIPVVLETSAD